MLRPALAAALALALASPAHAEPRPQPQHRPFLDVLLHGSPASQPARPMRQHGVRRVRVGDAGSVLGGRPRECSGIPWCGCWLRLRYGIKDVRLNVARAWARIGVKLQGPVAGAIAVWAHHVGEIVSVPGPGRIVLRSGNDGGAVRERERSTRGIIAYRRIG